MTPRPVPRRILVALEGWASRWRGAQRRARAAEAAGRLEEAVAAALEGDDRPTAARLLAVLARTTPEPLARLRRWHQVAEHAAGEELRAALGQAGELTLELHRAGALPLSRGELSALAARLRLAGVPALGARLAERAGDAEERERCLVEAGDVDALTAAPAPAAAAPDAARAIADLVATGARRLALERARAAPGGQLATLAGSLEARRPPTVLRLVVGGAPRSVVPGDPVVVGRAGELPVHAAAVGRHHLELRAGPPPRLRDLGSRHGTRVGGVPITEQLPVTGPLRLTLGDDVPLDLTPVGDGLRVAVAGEEYEVPLGPLPLEHATLHHEAGWVVVRRRERPLYLEGLEVEAVELLRGDRLTLERGGPPWLEVGA